MQYVAYRVFAMECVVFAISKVSIHAPARGAIFIANAKVQNYLFQFTHPRGVRYVTTAAINSDSSFNSRTREGCDARPEP